MNAISLRHQYTAKFANWGEHSCGNIPMDAFIWKSIHARQCFDLSVGPAAGATGMIIQAGNLRSIQATLHTQSIHSRPHFLLLPIVFYP